MAEVEDLAQQLRRLFRGTLQQLADAGVRIAEPGGGRHHLFGIGGMGQELDTHGPSQSNWTAPSGNRAESRDGTRKEDRGAAAAKQRRPRRAVPGTKTLTALFVLLAETL